MADNKNREKHHHCRQCNQPIKSIYRCPDCTTVYCSHMCRQRDTQHGHKKFVCGKVGPFEDLCRIVQFPGRNNGVVATQSLKPGDFILVETPSINRDSDLSKIPPSILDRLYELEPRPSKDLLRKFQYNAQLDRIFINFSYLNHSCKPNADFMYLKQYNIVVVVAVTAIPRDTEITINYFGGIEKDRRNKLYDRWGFHCECVGCTNKRFNTILNIIATLKDQIRTSDSIENCQTACDKLLELYPSIEASPLAYYEVYTIKAELASTPYEQSIYSLIAHKHFNKCLKISHVDIFI